VQTDTSLFTVLELVIEILHLKKNQREKQFLF